MGEIIEENKLTGLFEKIHNKKYDSTNCFLCGTDLNDKNRTDEHVFPRWLQTELDLWNQHITLLNGTTIFYRSLKIPCCSECNNKYLSTIENNIKKAFNGGYEEFIKIDENILFLWLVKIYYGILYKEMFVLMNRAKPDDGTIIPEKFIKDMKVLNLFLQEIRGKHRCVNFKPASIFILKLQHDDTDLMKWDFADRIATNFLSIRMRDIGIIAVLDDMHTTKDVCAIDDFYKINLHPIQFNELCAIIFYRSLLLNRTPFFASVQKEDQEYVETYLHPLQGFSAKSIFDDWDHNNFKESLSAFTGYPLDELLKNENMVMSWIHDEKMNVKEIPIREYRFTRFDQEIKGD
ncbi:MAG: hypothetical protein PQJ61_16585 [Spirochaetales bacterium]|uniref:HNH endonuclease n=1 Tax=Candidatus Thalassospirochaeta sargassi TaxID=3119039 RepID=A0AAJ1IFH5_9SPIO|nr:hypothetical protein [Spirochaetales bacterium]